MTETQFIYGYTIFLMFFLLMITMSSPSFLTNEAQMKLSKLNAPSKAPVWTEATCASNWLFGEFCYGGGLIGGISSILTTFWGGLNTLYIMLSFNATLAWVTFIITIPYAVTLFYIILRILRGGG